MVIFAFDHFNLSNHQTHWQKQFFLNFVILFFFQSSPNVLVDRKPVKELKKIKPKPKDSPDIETSPISDSSYKLLLQSYDSPIVYVGDADDAELISPVEHNDSLEITASNTDADSGFTRNDIPEAKIDEPSMCVVCQKVFKSKSCLNKHLKNVHTGWLSD